jgi:hypothetical protein
MLAETSVLTPKGTKTLFYMWYVFLVESAKRRQRNDLAIDLNQGERRRRTVPERGDWRSSAQGELLLRRDRPLSVEKGNHVESHAFRSWYALPVKFQSDRSAAGQTAQSVARNYLIESWDEDAPPPFKKGRGVPQKPRKCGTWKGGLARRRVTGAGTIALLAAHEIVGILSARPVLQWTGSIPSPPSRRSRTG